MKIAIKKMDRSKAAKFQKMIRESEEFDLNQMEDNCDANIYERNESKSPSDMNNCKNIDELNIEIIKCVQRKIDRREYSHTISKCQKKMKNDFDNWILGTGTKLLTSQLDKYYAKLNQKSKLNK